jgi:hypothetical protein
MITIIVKQLHQFIAIMLIYQIYNNDLNAATEQPNKKYFRENLLKLTD